ncbi:MAG: sterol desaturase family protein [Actinobacteria bacterium]|nr:sterol desaturase family protein [Actinomycetota bacterium]
MATSTQVRFSGNTRVRDVVPVYLRYPSARFLLTALIIVASARLWVGDWSWWDAVAVIGLIALQPFTEWVIHTFILHFKPRELGPLTLDLHLAKEHRRHHRDPRVIASVFIPMRSLWIGVPIGVAITILVVPSLPLALTLILTATVIGNIYEWTHFYVHSGCKPRNRYARYIERAHRLHHYRNEQYWMGVTNHAADHVLGTFPAKDDVPVSPTARTLGVD